MVAADALLYRHARGEPQDELGPMRLAKYLAHAGVASRRAAETVIAFHAGMNTMIVRDHAMEVEMRKGLDQGQFSLVDILANFKKKKVKPIVYRDNRVYPMGNSGMQVVFLNPTTMVFGQTDALKSALDARDGMAPNFLTNRTMLDQMQSVDTEAVWSVLDQEGTQTMMRSVLGDASQLTDFDTVKKRLVSSRYSMSFDNGVKFSLDVITPDTISAATMASLLNAAALYKKVSGTAEEKQAIDNTTINSSGGTLDVRFASSDSQFSSLLQSSLFQSVVR